MPVPNSMGIATALNFQPTGGGKAAITGDFVLVAKEVNPVIKALRQNGIAVTALHSHMLEEQPRIFFMHFWANDDALKLAKGLRAAPDPKRFHLRGRFHADSSGRYIIETVLPGHYPWPFTRGKAHSFHRQPSTVRITDHADLLWAVTNSLSCAAGLNADQIASFWAV